MLPKGHYERSVARKMRCADDIRVCELMGDKVCARIARAEWQKLHTHIQRMEALNDANTPPLPQWNGKSFDKIDTQGR